MGLIDQTIVFTTGVTPSATDWQNQFDTVYNEVNGELDSANVDKTSSDGIMVLDTAQTRTANLTMSQAGLTFSGSISASSWTTAGVVFKTSAATYTDTSTAGSGTAATAVFSSFGVPTLTATNSSVTTTTAATVYIAGAPTAGTNQTITNAYALWVDAGNVKFDAALTVNTMTLATGSITDSTGAINFGNENLSTTGTLTASGGGSLTGTWSDLGTVTTVDINGGTIDGVTIGGASAGAGTFTSLNVSDGNITNVNDIALDSISADGSSISVSSDTFWANSTGVVIGHGSQLALANTAVPELQVLGTSFHDTAIGGMRFSADTGGASLMLGSSRSATIGSNSVVQSGDVLGVINFFGDDGTDYQAEGARIQVEVDSTAGTGDMPSRMTFHTTADGAESPTERMRIDSNGSVIFGTGAISTSATDGFLYIPSMAGAPSGAPTDYSNLSAFCHDTTNNRLYVYDHVSNAWQYATLT